MAILYVVFAVAEEVKRSCAEANVFIVWGICHIERVERRFYLGKLDAYSCFLLK